MKLTIKEIFNNLKKENRDFYSSDVQTISINLIENDDLDYNKINQDDRIKAYFFVKWTCSYTDEVGFRAYTFDNKPFAISTQYARKDEQFFMYLNSISLIEDVKNYLKSRLYDLEERYTPNNIVDLDYEFDLTEYKKHVL